MDVHVKPSGKWRDVKINPNAFLGQDFSGFVCMQELVDYDIVKKGGTVKQGKNKKEDKNKSQATKMLSSDNKKKKTKRKLIKITGNEDSVTDNSKVTEQPVKKRRKTKAKCEDIEISEDRSQNESDSGEKDITVISEDTCSQGQKKKSKQSKCHLLDDTKKYKSEHLPDMSAWQNLFVPAPVLQALAEKGFTSPTPIQALTLAPAIRDRLDIVGAAETGSGKTLAFGIPLIHRILELKEKATAASDVVTDDTSTSDTESKSDTTEDESEEEMSVEDDIDTEITTDDIHSSKPLYALVLTPTRELAMQVKDHLTLAARYTGMKVIAVVGGMAPQKQSRLLRKCPEIVVATPGRLWELLQEHDEHLRKLTDISCLVVDEADRMVEKGHFQEMTQVLEIINRDEQKKEKRQTFVFSATLTFLHQAAPSLKFKKKLIKMTEKQKLEMLMAQIGMKPKRKVIDLTRSVGTAKTLTEARINTNLEDKDIYLYYFLHKYPGRTLVFANSKDCIRRLVSIFQLLRCSPLPLHADMQQRQRLKNLDRFKGNPRGLLLATDVAARGLDIPDVQHVIHYQVPRTTENYIHRSGRTARASKQGLSVMLISPEDLQYYRRIIKNLNRDDDLPLFPVDKDTFFGLKTRVNLARSIDKEEHRIKMKRHENLWYIKAAEEMDIELDDDRLLNDLGDDWEQSQARQRLELLKHQLKSELDLPIQKKRSGKYPTKSGKLLHPSDYFHECAITRLKEEYKEKSITETGSKKTKTSKKKHKYYQKSHTQRAN